MDRKSLFETKIKPVLQYIGIIGAILTSIAYIVVVTILIVGFNANYTGTKDAIVFAIVNAGIGLIILFFLKLQGSTFAKNLPENKPIIDAWVARKRPKEKKYHSMTFFWVKSSIMDFLFKGISIAFTTFGIIYIVIKGSNDYTLYLLAFVNLLLFVSFGLISLVKAYDFYNEEHIPFLKYELAKESEKENGN